MLNNFQGKRLTVQPKHDLRSVISDASASSALIKKMNDLLDSKTVQAAVDKASMLLLKEELVGGIRKRCDQKRIVFCSDAEFASNSNYD